MIKEENDITFVRALERGLLILDAFINEKRPLSIAELDRLLKLPRSTVWRLVKTLENNGYLLKKNDSEKYWPSSKVFQLSSVFYENTELHALSAHIILELRNQTRETIHLNIREDYHRVCIYCIEGLEMIRSANQTGQRSPLHLGASAKVLLAEMDNNFINQYIKDLKFDSDTAANLLNQIELCRRQGYFITKEERIPDMIAIGVPIKNASGITISSLALTAPLSRAKRVTDEYLAPVLQAAKDICTQLGYKYK